MFLHKDAQQPANTNILHNIIEDGITYKKLNTLTGSPDQRLGYQDHEQQHLWRQVQWTFLGENHLAFSLFDVEIYPHAMPQRLYYWSRPKILHRHLFLSVWKQWSSHPSHRPTNILVFSITIEENKGLFKIFGFLNDILRKWRAFHDNTNSHVSHYNSNSRMGQEMTRN